MGIVGFKWGDKELTLLMNRDNEGQRVIREANWVQDGCEETKVLGSRCEKTKGTWFGVTRGGRVAFLLDPMLVFDSVGSETITIRFLNSKLSPDMFAAKLEKEEEEFHLKYHNRTGRAYHLIVADITSGSMVYISKRSVGGSTVIKERVAFGVHTLSTQGPNSDEARDTRLRDFFSAMIVEYKDKELPEMHKLAAKFMYDTTEAVPGDELSALFVPGSSERDEYFYGTTSTTAFVVDKTKKAKFFERYWEKGIWKKKDFTFDIEQSVTTNIDREVQQHLYSNIYN